MAKLIQIEFNSLGRSLIKVAISNPCRSGSYVHKAWQNLTLASVGKLCQIDSLESFKFNPLRLICDTLVLDSALVAFHKPSNDECDLSILSQVVHFSRCLNGVEEDIELVSDDNADNRSLWRTGC